MASTALGRPIVGGWWWCRCRCEEFEKVSQRQRSTTSSGLLYRYIRQAIRGIVVMLMNNSSGRRDRMSAIGGYMIARRREPGDSFSPLSLPPPSLTCLAVRCRFGRLFLPTKYPGDGGASLGICRPCSAWPGLVGTSKPRAPGSSYPRFEAIHGSLVCPIGQYARVPVERA